MQLAPCHICITAIVESYPVFYRVLFRNKKYKLTKYAQKNNSGHNIEVQFLWCCGDSDKIGMVTQAKNIETDTDILTYVGTCQPCLDFGLVNRLK